MRVVHSLLHPDDLAGLVEREYDLPGPVRVRLLHRGFNDTYVVTDATGKRRALRVYTRDKYWIRSTSDVQFELELLEHLAMAGRWVTRPCPRRGGGFLGTVPAPEGRRGYAVFDFALGPSVSDQPMAVERWHAFGSEIAWMHRSMDEFRSEHDRYHLDLGILLDMPLAAIELFRGPDSPETERAQWSALHPDERAALPVFAACRALWNIGDWLQTVERTGQAWRTTGSANECCPMPSSRSPDSTGETGYRPDRRTGQRTPSRVDALAHGREPLVEHLLG